MAPPSPGCTNCKRAKKRCDQKRPSCGRCFRLQQQCHDYADDTDIGEEERWQASMLLEVKKESAKVYLRSFLMLFCKGEYEILGHFAHSPVVQNLMEACALAVTAGTREDGQSMTHMTTLFAQALKGVRHALSNDVQARQDVTLISVILVCIFERLSPFESGQYLDTRIHLSAMSHLVKLRGLPQVQTQQGRAIFRLARRMLLDNAIRRREAVPYFLVVYTQGTESEPLYSAVDRLAVIVARLCTALNDAKSGALSPSVVGNLRSDLEDFWVGGDLGPTHAFLSKRIDPGSCGLDMQVLLLEWQHYLGLVMELDQNLSPLQADMSQNSFASASRSMAGLGIRMAIYLRGTSLLDVLTLGTSPRGWVPLVLRLVGPLGFSAKGLQQKWQECCEQTSDAGTTTETSSCLMHVMASLRNISASLHDRLAMEVVRDLGY